MITTVAGSEVGAAIEHGQIFAAKPIYPQEPAFKHITSTNRVRGPTGRTLALRGAPLGESRVAEVLVRIQAHPILFGLCSRRKLSGINEHAVKIRIQGALPARKGQGQVSEPMRRFGDFRV